jgi:hypothetical protein
MILADLGCEISTLAVDMNGKVFQTGSSDGNTFLSSNPEIGIKFRGYFGELQEFSYFVNFIGDGPLFTCTLSLIHYCYGYMIHINNRSKSSTDL